MDRVSVNPGKVRCLGNIVSPKTSSDFGALNGTVSSSSDTVNNQSMTVYSTDYLVGSSLSLNVGDVISGDVDGFTVYATLKNNSNTAVSSATVYCEVNGAVTSATTDSNGVASFTVSTDGSSEYRIRAYYTGSVSLAGSSAYKVVNVAELTLIELFGTDVIIETGDNLELFAKVTDAVSGVPVNFYLESDDNRAVSTISLSASSSSVSPNSTVTLTGTLSAGTGLSVKVYGNGSLLDTVTTSTDGAFTYTSGALTSDTSFYVVFDGDTSYQGCSSDTVTVTVTKSTPTISLATSSASVTYGGSFTLSGTLSVGSGVSVKLYNGSSLVATVTTGTDGAFSKQISNAGVGSYSYTAVFEETASYYGVTSSAVAVTVSKATPTISLSTSSASVTVGDSFILSGTISLGSGVSVKLYNGSALVDTLTSTTGGAFSKTITSTTAGTYSYTAVYEGSANYNSVTSTAVSVTVSAPSVDSIVLASEESVLSAYHNDKTDLIATVYDSSDNVLSGITVEFFKGTTSLGTATSDNSGIALLEDAYTATGVGDVSFTASADGVDATAVTVEDCEMYDATGFSKTTTTSTDTSYPTGYSWYKPDTGNFQIEFDYNAPEKMRLYLTKTNIQSQGQDIQYGIGVTRSGTKLQYTNRTTSSSNTTCGTMATGARHIKWTIEGTTVKLYMDGTLQTTKTVSWMGYPLYFAWSIWTANTATVTNIKVKPL